MDTSKRSGKRPGRVDSNRKQGTPTEAPSRVKPASYYTLENVCSNTKPPRGYRSK